MAINVKHGTNAGAVAGAAFGGAQGQARQRAAIGGAQAATEEERRRRGLLARQQAVAPDAPAATAPAAPATPVWDPKLGGSPPVGYDPQAATLAAMTPEQREARARMDYASQIRQREAQAAQERTQQNTEFSLTTKQRMDLEQLASAEAEAMASPDFTAAEKEELRRRFAAKRAGIQPVERPKAPTAAELFRQNTYTDQRTGRVYRLDENGLPERAIYEPPERQPTMQDRANAFKAATAFATNAETGAVDEGRLEWAMQRMGLGGAGGPGASGAGWGQGEGGDPSMAGYEAAIDGDLETHSGRYDDFGSGGSLGSTGQNNSYTSGLTGSQQLAALEAQQAAMRNTPGARADLTAPRGSGTPAGHFVGESIEGEEGAFYASPGNRRLMAAEAAQARTVDDEIEQIEGELQHLSSGEESTLAGLANAATDMVSGRKQTASRGPNRARRIEELRERHELLTTKRIAMEVARKQRGQ